MSSRGERSAESEASSPTPGAATLEQSGASERATSVELPRSARARGQKPVQSVGDEPATQGAPTVAQAEPKKARLDLSRTLNELVGTMMGNFRLVAPLATGGMGAVFLARKEGPSGIRQHAALKLVHAQHAGQRDFIDMFLDEARIASYVQHPNVCRVLDFGVSRGTYYLAMEYVHGETWAELVECLVGTGEAEALVADATAFVLAEACEGLHAAHVATGDDGRPLQIVHRDMSPQNIFVAYDGTVRVIDFGVARARDRITSTRAGVVKGKIAYMSPEQITGGVVDHRSDVWALGVILREALEGERLFRRNNDTETVRALVLEPIPEWSKDVDPVLRSIADRALSRDPRARYQSAREMGAALVDSLLAKGKPMDGAELSQLMRRLFARQIADKSAVLRSEPVYAKSPSPSTPSGAQAEKGDAKAQDERTYLSEHPATRREAALRTARWAVPVALLAGLLAFFVLRSRHESSAVPGAMLVPADAEALEVRAMELPIVLGPAIEHVQSPLADEAPAARPVLGAILVAYAGGWAEVYARGRLLGTTPGLFRLPVGSHQLLIKPFGKGPGFTRQVSVAEGEPGKLLIGQ